MIITAKSNTYVNKGMKTTVSVQKVVHFIFTIIGEDFVDRTETHDFWEIVYIESGEALVFSDDKEFRLLSGEAYFHKPGEAHRIKAVNGAISVFFISFYSQAKFMALFEGLRISLTKEQKRLTGKIYGEARNIFEKGSRNGDPDAFVSASLKENSPIGSQQLYRMHLEEFLLLSAREAERQKTIVTYDSKENFEKLILEHIIETLHEKIYSSFTIEDLCRDLNYSRTYLSKIFKAHRKTTIMNHYNQLKIKEAKKLMRDRGCSVTETAKMLCFNNPYYFSKVFKRYEGMSPSEYKRG